MRKYCTINHVGCIQRTQHFDVALLLKLFVIHQLTHRQNATFHREKRDKERDSRETLVPVIFDFKLYFNSA
jgi:hypothetical protein